MDRICKVPDHSNCSTMQTREACRSECLADPSCISFVWVRLSLQCEKSRRCTEELAIAAGRDGMDQYVAAKELWIKGARDPTGGESASFTALSTATECGRLLDELKSTIMLSERTGGRTAPNAIKPVPSGSVCTARCQVAPPSDSQAQSGHADGHGAQGALGMQSNFTCVNGSWVGELKCPANPDYRDPPWEGNEITLKDGSAFFLFLFLSAMGG